MATKKVFTNEYPSESIREIEKYIEKTLLDENGNLKDGAYNATIIVEIITNE